MKRWYSLLEIFLFPLKFLFVGVVMISLSSLVLNTNASVFWSVSDTNWIIIANYFRTVGNFIVVNFPFIVLIKMLSRKGTQGIQSEIGILGYIVFMITTMYFASQRLPATAYSTFFGLSLNTSKIAGLSGTTQTPLQMGLIGVLFIGFLARIVYQKSRSKTQYGFFGFIDKDTYAIILMAASSLLVGIAFSYIWPYVIQMLNNVFNFIASDINNPMNLFVYGVMDRLLSVVNLGGMIRQGFWFTELGGSWIDIAGANYVGDVNIWMAQIARGSFPLGFGRFITPYYMLNLFAIPGMAIALYSLYTDKMEKRRLRPVLVIGILASLLGGTILPLEMFILIVSPLLYFFHLIVTGALFGLCQVMNISLGFSYSGNTIAAMPGNIFDILIYVRDPSGSATAITVLMIGAGCFVFYFLMTRIYYQFFAIDLFHTGLTKKKVEGFILAVGGLENIKRVNSSLFRLTIQVVDPEAINFEHFRRLGAYKVLEIKAGYAIQFGSGSTIIKNELNKQLRETKRKIDS